MTEEQEQEEEYEPPEAVEQAIELLQESDDVLSYVLVHQEGEFDIIHSGQWKGRGANPYALITSLEVVRRRVMRRVSGDYSSMAPMSEREHLIELVDETKDRVSSEVAELKSYIEELEEKYYGEEDD